MTVCCTRLNSNGLAVGTCRYGSAVGEGRCGCCRGTRDRFPFRGSRERSFCCQRRDSALIRGDERSVLVGSAGGDRDRLAAVVGRDRGAVGLRGLLGGLQRDAALVGGDEREDRKRLCRSLTRTTAQLRSSSSSAPPTRGAPHHRQSPRPRS